MAKKRCRLSKEEYAQKMNKPAGFYCRKCRRKARKSKRLCKPVCIEKDCF